MSCGMDSVYHAIEIEDPDEDMYRAALVPVIALLVLRAWYTRSLTPLGIFAAAITAIVHAIHPWPIFFVLLAVFFLTGPAVTKVSRRLRTLRE